MPKLIVKKKAEIIDEIELDESKSIYTLGIDENNDFFVSDRKVSTKHLRIEFINGNYYLEDLKSAFGTTLNGSPIFSRTQIVHGDEIGISDYILVFENFFKTLPYMKKNKIEEFEKLEESVLEDAPGIPDKDIDNQAKNIEQEESDSGQELGQSSEIISYHLLAVYGPYLGKKFPLKFGDTKIGRDNKLNDIIVRVNEKGELDTSISRRHATVSYKNGQFFISDKRSKTRTRVNQRKLNPSDEIPLNLGDEIEIVSDQKSTIFRLVTNDKLDFSPPKMAGTWWVRKGRYVGTALSIMLCVISIVVIYISMKNRLDITKRPDPLKAVEELWYASRESGPAVQQQGLKENFKTMKSSLALTDLTGDEQVDLVFIDKSGHLVALDGTSKKIIWKNIEFQVNRNIPIGLEDINENGIADILVIGEDTRLRALDGTNGAEIWLSPILGESLSGPPVIADLNGDRLKDVLACTEVGQIHLGYGDIYTINWKTIHTGFTFRSVPSAWDWDGNGFSDVFIGTEEGKVLIVNGSTGEVVRIFDFKEAIHKATGVSYETYHIRNPIALADLNGNQVVDLLIGSTNGNFLAMEGKALNRLWYDYFLFDYDNKDEILASLIGDLNGDEVDDVVLVSNYKIRAIKGSGEIKKPKQVLWECAVDSLEAFITSTALADVNKDKSNDVIVCNQHGTVYILNGKNGKIIDTIVKEGNPPISPLLVADIGGDSNLDILLIREDFNIYKIETNCRIPKNVVIWGQAYSDGQHTGRLHYINPKAFSYDMTMITSGLIIFGVFFSNRAIRKNRHKKIQNG